MEKLIEKMNEEVESQKGSRIMLSVGDIVSFKYVPGRSTEGINKKPASNITLIGKVSHNVVDDTYSVGYQVVKQEMGLDERSNNLAVLYSKTEIHYGFYKASELTKI